KGVLCDDLTIAARLLAVLTLTSLETFALSLRKSGEGGAHTERLARSKALTRLSLSTKVTHTKAVGTMQSRRLSGLPLVGIVTVSYFIAGKLGLTLASLNASASPVWPPAGIALAALLLLGYRVWPAILVGAFLVNV